MDYELVMAIIALLSIILALVNVVLNTLNSRRQIKGQQQKWENRYRSGELSKDDKGLEAFPFANPQMNQQVRLLLLEKKKIKAIKTVRDQCHNLQLREAKDYVEAIEKTIRD